MVDKEDLKVIAADAAKVDEVKDLKIEQMNAREKVMKTFKKVKKFDIILAIVSCMISYLFYLYHK